MIVERGITMKYEEIVEKVKVATSKANVSRAVGHIAFQFNVEGEGEGAFYLEIADGKVYVEPYEYYDRDVIIVTTADVIMQMIEDGLQPMVAYTNEQMKVYGNINHLKVLPLGCDSKQSSKVNSEQKAEPDSASDSKTKTDTETNTAIETNTVSESKTVSETNSISESKTVSEAKSVPVKKTNSEKKLRKRHMRK